MAAADDLAEPPGPDDLDRLAAAAAAGDPVALNDLLLAVEPRVKRIAARMLPHPQDAEEAAQDALLAVSKNISRFEGRSRFTTWLHAVASNSARSTYRTLKRRRPERPTEELWSAVDPRTTSVIAGSRLDLLEALESLAASHPELVEPLVLRDVNRLDYDEIARLLGVPLGDGEVADPPGPDLRSAPAARRGLTRRKTS